MTNQDNEMMIKKLSAIGPWLTLIFMFVTFGIGFYAVQVVAEHNLSSKAHPDIILAIAANKAVAVLLEQTITSNQKVNDAAHERQEKAQERILNAIDRLDAKIP